MAAVPHFQLKHISRMSAPAPLSQSGAGATPLPTGACRDCRPAAEEKTRSDPSASSSSGASAPAAAGQEPCKETIEISEEGLMPGGGRAAFTRSYNLPTTARISDSPGYTLLSQYETLYYLPPKPFTAPAPRCAPCPSLRAPLRAARVSAPARQRSPTSDGHGQGERGRCCLLRTRRGGKVRKTKLKRRGNTYHRVAKERALAPRPHPPGLRAAGLPRPALQVRGLMLLMLVSSIFFLSSLP